MSVKIVQCRVNHKHNPLAYQIETPIFSFKVIESEGKHQEAARIVVSKDDNFESIIIDTGWSHNLDSLGHAIEMTLAPLTRYYWMVSVRSEAGDEATSELNWFETGKINQAWSAKWISCKENEGRHPIFRKKISLKEKVAKARLYICGLGLYEATINQKKVGNEFLTPYSNNYNEWLQYQTYDITEHLIEENEIEVVLGNGWFKGRFGFDKTDKTNHYGDAWELIAEIHIEYIDGTTEIFDTDESWKVRYGNILTSSIYDGESVNNTLEDTEEESVILSHRGSDKLVERLSLPVTIQERLKPLELIITPKGETVLDMGQNHAGIFELTIHEPKGTQIHLQFGEILQDGNFYRDNLRTAKAEYWYVSNGEATTLRPKFTYYGYRYVKIEGVNGFNKDDFTSCVLYSYLPKIGVLSTGNEKVNRLIENVDWSLKSNFIDVPTDCPQRDERMGWTGDAQVFSKTASYLRDSYAFYEKYLYDIGQEQKRTAGRVPNYIPSFGDEGTSSVWGDAVCIIPWNVYMFTGDTEILEKSFPSMIAWLRYIQKIDGKDKGWDNFFHFGDWLALDRKNGVANEVMGATPIDYISRVYYLNSLKIVWKTATILGETKLADEFKEMANDIASYVQNEYFSPNGRSVVQTQTGLLMALQFELINKTDFIIKTLKEKFEETNHKLDTGFIGTSMICDVLAENGMIDLAYELLLNEEFPGWLYAVNLGATTIWERWNSVSPDGKISGSGMNSLNHYSYGSIVEFLFKHCAGIQPREEAPGFRKAKIAPQLNWYLRKVSASYQSQAGTYSVQWELIDSNHVTINVEVPFNCQAVLMLPNADLSMIKNKDNPIFEHIEGEACLLHPGKYSVTYETTKNFRKIYNTYSPIKELLYHSAIKKFLEQNSPTILQVPVEMRHYSMREMAINFMGGDEDEKRQITQQFDQLDAVLETIE